MSAVVLTGVACGGTPASALNDGGTVTDVSTLDGGDATDDAASLCRSPDGFQVCGGPNDCPSGAIAGCACPDATTTSSAAICENAASQNLYDTSWFGCPSDHAIADIGGALICVPVSVAQLLLQNGDSANVYFTDFSPFSSARVNEPSSCPSLAGFDVCGGPCSPCADGASCTGISPLHPLGFCFESVRASCGGNYPACLAGEGCLTFVTSSSTQAFADAHGYCLSTSECNALANELPGGAACTTP